MPLSILLALSLILLSLVLLLLLLSSQSDARPCLQQHDHSIWLHRRDYPQSSSLRVRRSKAIISETQVEHVIIPMPHEHFVILVPNIAIMILTAILIIFYFRQSVTIKQSMANTQQTSEEIDSASLSSATRSNRTRRSFQRSRFGRLHRGFRSFKQSTARRQHSDPY